MRGLCVRGCVGVRVRVFVRARHMHTLLLGPAPPLPPPTTNPSPKHTIHKPGHMITGGIEVLLLSLALLFNFLGLAALAGLALIALTVPLNAWLNRRMKRMQARIMQRCVRAWVGGWMVLWGGGGLFGGCVTRETDTEPRPRDHAIRKHTTGKTSAWGGSARRSTASASASSSPGSPTSRRPSVRAYYVHTWMPPCRISEVYMSSADGTRHAQCRPYIPSSTNNHNPP